MSRKTEAIFFICVIFGPIALERFGVIRGNWLTDLRDALLVMAAVSSCFAVYKLEDLIKEIQDLKEK